MGRYLLVVFAVLLSATSVFSIQCYTCDGEDWNVNCRRDANLRTCDSDEYCQTEIEKSGSSLSITKRCKESNACMKQDENNHRYCWDGIVKSKCRYCCDTDECNDDITHYHEAFDECGPWSKWSECKDCKRTRSRTCGESSKSGSKSGSKSSTKSSSKSDSSDSRRRRDLSEEEEEEEEEVLEREKRKKSGSKSGSGSGELTTETEEDNCCRTSCQECDSIKVDFSWSIVDFLDVLSKNCSLVSCPSEKWLCSTMYSFDDDARPTLSKGCTNDDTCRSYESSEECPPVVMNDAESIYVGMRMEAGTKCSYCCDNGPDTNAVVCNQGILPPWQYIYSGSAHTAASVLATVAMATVAYVFRA